MNSKTETLKKNIAERHLGGGHTRIDSQHAKGKLTARKQLHFLFDDGRFEETGMFVTHRSVEL